MNVPQLCTWKEEGLKPQLIPTGPRTLQCCSHAQLTWPGAAHLAGSSSTGREHLSLGGFTIEEMVLMGGRCPLSSLLQWVVRGLGFKAVFRD